MANRENIRADGKTTGKSTCIPGSGKGMGKFRKEASETGKMVVSDFLFLRLQHGCDDHPVSVFYLYAGFAGGRTGRYRIYVAPGTYGYFWRGVYMEPAGI